MAETDDVTKNPYQSTCHALHKIADAAKNVANHAGQLERFASSLRMSVERLTSRTTEAAVDLEAGVLKMTLLGGKLLERDLGAAADALRGVAQTLAAFDVPQLHQVLAVLANLADDLECKLPPHN